MTSGVSNNRRVISLVSLIIAGESIFFLPFVLARIFRPTLLAVFQITNTELGSYFSIYGVVAMVSYIFGGTLADRFPARNLMAIALWLTALGGFVMGWIPPSGIMKLIYGFYGFTSIFMFWAAMIRATREWGGTRFQGRAFGWLEGGRGATAAVLGTLALVLFSHTSAGTSAAVINQEPGFKPFQLVIFAVSGFTFLSGLLVWFFVPVSDKTKDDKQDTFDRHQMMRLLRLPKMWMLSIMIVCAYVGYKITDDYSLFAKEVLGYSEINAAGVGTAALWMRALVAILAGFLADRWRKANVIAYCFAVSVVGGLLLGLGVGNQIGLLMILNLMLTMLGVYGVRALYFAILKEAQIPLGLTGTAVGIVSFIGFTPDVFMSPWMGYLLDNHPGAIGHQYVFLLLAIFAFVGFITTLVFNRMTIKS